MTRLVITGEYPPDWKEIATRVKDEAGWHCVRCGHAHDPKTGYTLGTSAVRPIKLDMARTAKSNEVSKSIGFPVSLDTEFTKRHDMCDRKGFGELISMNAAVKALVPVSMARLVALLSPVGAVIGDIAAFPMRAIVGNEMRREPLQPAFIAAETLGGFARSHLTLCTAIFTLIGYTLLLAAWCAFYGAVFSVGKSRRNFKCLATGRTSKGNLLRLLPCTTRPRASLLLFADTAWPGERLIADDTSLSYSVVLAF